MRKIRVLIVDDSLVICKLLTMALGADPAIEIVGSAPNGRIALSMLAALAPDLITLDVEMPEMNGLEALAALRKTHPKLPVIMFSTLTQRGASTTLEALALGATDYIMKPANVGSVSAAIQRIRDELIPKIKILCSGSVKVEKPPILSPRQPLTGSRQSAGVLIPPTPSRPIFQRGSSQRIEVVMIGVSTGGPQALATLLPQLPAHFPVPIVLVQHMPPIFTKLLAERLAGQCAIQVNEGVTGGELKAGSAWIAPGDYHMLLERQGTAVRLRLQQEPPENSCRPAVDVLFRSAAKVYGAQTLAVVLTGMGQDGLRGCEAIKKVGGQVVVQDEASSVVWGMPGFVARAGLADAVLPLNRLAAEIIQRVERGRSTSTGQRETAVKSQTGQVQRGA